MLCKHRCLRFNQSKILIKTINNTRKSPKVKLVSLFCTVSHWMRRTKYERRKKERRRRQKPILYHRFFLRAFNSFTTDWYICVCVCAYNKNQSCIQHLNCMLLVRRRLYVLLFILSIWVFSKINASVCKSSYINGARKTPQGKISAVANGISQFSIMYPNKICVKYKFQVKRRDSHLISYSYVVILYILHACTEYNVHVWR